MSRWQEDTETSPTVVRRVLREDYEALSEACGRDLELRHWVAESYRLFCAQERELRRVTPKDNQPITSAATVAKYSVLRWATTAKEIRGAREALSYGTACLMAMAAGEELLAKGSWGGSKASGYVGLKMVYGESFMAEVDRRRKAHEARP